MCGIVGAIAKRDISQILLDGLKRLEYRGYDSAGLAIIFGITVFTSRSNLLLDGGYLDIAITTRRFARRPSTVSLLSSG